MMPSQRKKIDLLLDRSVPFSAKEARLLGVTMPELATLCAHGEIERVSRGIYIFSSASLTENFSLQIAALKASRGIVCLLSALRFHNLTTQLPTDVWLAIPSHGWIPQCDNPQLQIVTMSGDAYTHGIECHLEHGITIKVFSVAKTVADCFKYRNKIGLDIALEALKEGWQHKRFSVDDLMAAARVCRVERVITPYMESLLACPNLISQILLLLPPQD